MAYKKQTLKYFFSVEGETEELYLKWLENEINSDDNAKYRVSLNPDTREPIKFVKSLNTLGKTTIYHLMDYESDEAQHVERFMEVMRNMKKAQDLGKQVKYKLCYSNLTFDLWIILHKVDCYTQFAHRKNYLSVINRAYNEKFESMKEFKEGKNLERCLKKLNIDNVMDAVSRANKIMRKNTDNGYMPQQFMGYKYYRENPSLEVGNVIGNILSDCGLIKK